VVDDLDVSDQLTDEEIMLPLTGTGGPPTTAPQPPQATQCR
jgi:hypothetical protein